MNKLNETTLKHIVTRAKQYQGKVSEILDGYTSMMEKTKHEAAIRKDEAEYISANQEKHSEATRHLLQKEQEAFASEVRNASKELKGQLIDALSQPVHVAVNQQLTLMHTFGIAPSRTQIENLVDLNGGNLLGLQAINALLTETKAPYTVKCFDVGDYERDLATLEHLAENSDHYIPTDHHAVGCDLYRGTDKVIKRYDGQEVHTGFEWDSVALLLRNTSVDNDVKRIEEMKQRWATDISTPIMDRASAAVKEEEAEQARVEGKPVPTDPDPERTATVQDTSAETEAIALARKLGQEKSGNIAAYRANMPHFVK